MMILPSTRSMPAQDAPLGYRFQSSGGHQHLLVVPFSRIYDLPAEFAGEEPNNTVRLSEKLARALSLPMSGEQCLDDVVSPAPQSISLNVSNSCNLGCSYCYASQGGFGGKQAAPMSWQTAQTTIDRLLVHADPQAPITIGFMGGEPFVNRDLIRRCVAYGAAQAARRGLDIRYSVTTNGTLLRAEDHELLRAHRFAVTVSIDGGADVQNRQRPSTTGTRDSFGELKKRLQPLIEEPGLAKLSARATVTSSSLALREQFESIVSLGFTDVGFSPLRAAKEIAGALIDRDWEIYQDAIIDLARSELSRALAGKPIRLANFGIAMKQLYVGACSPFPCGAGGGYFSVSASGEWYACHRAIGQDEYRLGDNANFDHEKRKAFLATRHVHAQTDCRVCWARYLCGGGCHQEKSRRTTASCDFIRNWLTFCLESYCELNAARPDYFDALTRRGAP